MKTIPRLVRVFRRKTCALLLAVGQLTAGGVHAGIAGDSISVNDVSIVEGNTGTSTLTFTVSRVGNAAAFSLNWATADSTAAAPGDYTAATGTLNFPAGGSLTETISVTIMGDAAGESDETLFVNLSNLVPTAGSASLSDAQGIGTITDNDAVAPAITTQPSNAFVVAGATRTLTVVATGNPTPSF